MKMIDRKTCKDCRYWADRKSEGWQSELGDCYNNSFIEQGVCDPSADSLVYYDHEGYSAGFYTGPDFGCRHFEKVKHGKN